MRSCLSLLGFSLSLPPSLPPSLQTVNADYKARLTALSNLVLVKFLEDTMVQPRESEVNILLGSALTLA